MKNVFVDFIIDLYNEVPLFVYGGLLLVFFIGVFIVIRHFGYKRGLYYTYRLLLTEYIFFILCSTILLRSYNGYHAYEFRPFWSYKAIIEGRTDLLPENVMNVLVFVPVGLLIGCGFRGLNWWKTMLIGLCVSALIEAMQYYLMRGFSEADDVIHNTFGCMMGYWLFLLLRKAYEKFSKRPVAVL